ncbi:uncharacterized protein LOC119726081 [Patiria miniata]|uniref:Uncharacterized protein n=1 Tax=Patiria miniata TaxID=46514 RepID=A0A913ZQG6_PATMI|nr:uncharacterized protein LOC119726081 [Patiria miniata]
MKAIALVIVCLLAVARSIHVEDLHVSFCDTEQCTCTPAQTFGLFSAVYMDDLGCYCSCGSSKDESCSKDGDCIQGLHCAAGEEKGGHGRCEDACKKPGFSCGKFEKCSAESGEPVCKCKMYECSDLKIGMGICADDPVQNKKVTFLNDCQYVNVNCERLKANQKKLTKLPISDCAEPNPIFEPGLNAFQFEKRY